jgi:peptidoglycan hydrolase-like protein with peptidoglycan-binding domain
MPARAASAAVSLSTPAPTSAATPPSTSASAVSQASPAVTGVPPTPPADVVAGPAPARDGTPLTSDEVRDLQKRLKVTGFDPGPIDGIVGPLTQDAAHRYAAARTLGSADPGRGMLVHLRAEPTKSAQLPPR